MSVSRLDQLYRKLLLTKFFTKGWGNPDNLRRIFEFRKKLGDREQCQHLVSSDYPINIDKEYRDGDCRILEGHFKSPFVDHLPGIMPKEVERANFQVILPVHWKDPTHKPVCIHLAGTGDHFFWRRRLLTARPLLKEAGIASILLENPYYGTRKPKGQLRSSLHNVSDLFVMGGALVLESMALLHWCEREGWGPLGISGVSMGGHMASGVATLWPKPLSVVPILSWTTASIIFTEMASLAATNWTKPIPLIPILSWSTASCVFTQGVMSGAIPWHTLQEQFFKNSVYSEELKKQLVSPEDKHRAYHMGQQFARDLCIDPSHPPPSLHDPTLTSTSGGAKRFQSAADLALARGARPFDSRLKAPTDSKSISDHPSQTDITDPAVMVSEEYVIRSQHISEKFSSPPSTSEPSSFSQSDSEEEVTKDSEPDFVAAHPSMMSSGITPTTFPPKSVSKSSSTFLSEGQSPSEKSSVSLSSSLSSKEISGQPRKGHALSLSYAQSKTVSGSSKDKEEVVSQTNQLTLKLALSKSKLIQEKQPDSQSDGDNVRNLEREALDFMRGVMDECTHLGNFSVPVDPELIIIVLAKQDAYIPRDGVLGLDQLWPGCEIRYVDQGHVGAVLFNQSVFRKAIMDAFEKQAKKYGKKFSPASLTNSSSQNEQS